MLRPLQGFLTDMRGNRRPAIIRYIYSVGHFVGCRCETTTGVGRRRPYYATNSPEVVVVAVSGLRRIPLLNSGQGSPTY